MRELALVIQNEVAGLCTREVKSQRRTIRYQTVQSRDGVKLGIKGVEWIQGVLTLIKNAVD